MALEIERKFLVKPEWVAARPAGLTGQDIRQGYLSSARAVTTRVRISQDKAWLTVKSATTGCTRFEFEYEIPLEDAQTIYERTTNRVAKTRYCVRHAEHVFEVDVFEGSLKGLVLAEVELDGEGEEVVLPPWLGEEVTHDPAYYNEVMARDGLPRR